MRSLLTLMLAFSACERSPDDPVFFFGEARSTAGQALSGAEISLLRRSCSYFRLPDPSTDAGVMEELDRTQVKEDGSFLIRLFGYQVSPGPEGYSCFKAELEPGPSGATSTVEWVDFRSDVAVSPFLRWDDGDFELRTDGGTTVVPSPFPLPPSEALAFEGPIAPDFVGYGWALSVGGEPLWQQEATSAPLTFDPALLEDFGEPVAIGLQLLGELNPERFSPFAGVRYRLEAGTRRQVLETGFTVPVSRGASCAWRTTPIDPCPFTDGTLERTEVTAPFLENGRVPPFVFTLPRPASLRLLVLRNTTFNYEQVAVEGSEDGETWVPLAIVPSSFEIDSAYDYLSREARFAAIDLAPTERPVRFVRLDPASGVLRAREISFFE